MLRLVSLLGIACLAVAAVSLTKNNPSAIPARKDETLDLKNRLSDDAIIAVLPLCPTFHARFSLN